jgi:hypothetical protein
MGVLHKMMQQYFFFPLSQEGKHNNNAFAPLRQQQPTNIFLKKI